jgi:hypothetical protein
VTTRTSNEPRVICAIVGILFVFLICTVVFRSLLAYDAHAQSFSYSTSQQAKVSPGTNNTARVLCNKGDGLLTGGFSIAGFTSPNSISGAFLYKNQPLVKSVPAANISNPSNPSVGVFGNSSSNFTNLSQSNNMSNIFAPKPKPENITKEGWEAGLVNTSNESLQISAQAVCIILKR